MATPIKEQISAKALARLQAITVAAGYEVTLTKVSRPTRLGEDWSPDNLEVLLLQGDALRVADEDGAIGYEVWDQDYVADLYGLASDDSAVAVDIAMNQAEAAIQKAIMSDPQWDGLAIDTTLGDVPAFDARDGSFVLRSISFTVLYRTLEGNPYAQ